VLGRRLDRYVGAFFAWHFLLSLVAILGLYVVIDTFTKLDELIEQEGVFAQLRWIAVYHAYQIPVLLTQFLPVVTLLAGIIAIARLARYNEINAIKAAGVSVHRTLLPIFLASLAIGALGAANQEILVPSLEYDILNVRTTMRGKDVYRDLFVYDRSHKTTIWVRRLDYLAGGYELSGVAAEPRDLLDPAEKPELPRIRGAHAVWVGTWLFLSDGQAQAPDGTWQPFAYKSLTTNRDASEFAMPGPPGKAGLGGATIAHIEAGRNGHTLEVTFTEWKPKNNLRLIVGGQLTGAFEGAKTTAPTSIQAALWDGTRWLGRAQSYRQVSDRRREDVVYDGEPLPIAMPPQELVKSSADPSLKSFRQLLALAAEVPALRQKILVVLHSRLAFPLASFVLLLVAVPLLFQQEGGKSTWVGVGLALVVSGCFYLVSYTCQLVGQTPGGVFDGSPAAAAWLPIVLFGATGVALAFRMDT